MDNDDLLAACVVFTICVLLYLYMPNLTGVWIP